MDVPITVPKEIMDFIEARRATGEFASKSHGFQLAVRFYMNNEDLARKQLAEASQKATSSGQDQSDER